MFRSTTVIRELQCPLPKSLLFNHSCMYAKRGGVAAYHIVWIGLCLRSVPGVRVLASAVDVVHSTTTPPRLAYIQLWLTLILLTWRIW